MTAAHPVTSHIADYAAMLTIRKFEEKVRDLRLAGDIVGSVHLAIGQEAGPVGACTALLPEDALFATYRGHGWAIARGVPLAGLFAEILGREAGVNGGRGGSAYLSSPSHGFHGENSIVGAGVPIAVGAALAGRHDGTGRVAITVFGDGAMNQGSVHEGLNFASAFRLPVVFVCENNYWSELTAIHEMVGEPELWKRAEGYGMRGLRLDGNDPVAVRKAVGEALSQARSGAGPVLLELMTERLVGHYIGDAEQYRRPGEVEAAQAREPIVRSRALCLEGGADDDELDDIAAEVAEEIEQAAAAALAGPLPDPATVKENVYA